ncbi:MAG: hypothetical protein M1833_000540 [Piccolia ochrophora]|nr:MAG: hypothetical protein M1833_000540 [Piccolia ochrophora]
MASSLPPDPYAALGVPRDATLPAIRAAYRKLILKTHPDKIQDAALRAQKQDEFQRIQQAYELLSDDTQRREYHESLKAAEMKSRLGSDRVNVFRFEVRTAAPRGDFERVYEQRKAARSYDDDLHSYFEDRSSSRKHDMPEIRRTSRGFDDRKASRAADENLDRLRMERERQRQNDKEYQSERRRTRERERRRGYDEKYASVDLVDDEDDSDRHRSRFADEGGKRRGGEHRRRERLSNETIRKDSGRRFVDDKLESARLHIAESTRSLAEDDVPIRSPRLQRAATSYFDSRHSGPPMEDTVRRSRARGTPERDRERERERDRDRDRDRERDRERERERDRDRDRDRDKDRGLEAGRSRSTRKGSNIEIVEPPLYETRTGSVPSMPKSASSPAEIRIPRSSRDGPLPQRSATMEVPSLRDTRPAIPPITRSSTMPINESSRRREYMPNGSSRLKTVELPVDSGYSSPGTPEEPNAKTRSSPSPRRRGTAEYIVVEEGSSPFGDGSRHRKVYMEPEDEAYEHHDRSISPHSRIPREGGSSGRMPPSRTTKYSYSAEPEVSRGSPRGPPGHGRHESTSSPRGSPIFLRTESGSKVRSSPRRSYGSVQYSHPIVEDDVVYAEPRRGSEALYREVPHSPAHHFGHEFRHPGLMRAGTAG